MKKVVLVCLGISMLTACVQNSTEYQQLKAESDSLKLENARYASEMNEMLSVLNDIEADFQSIRDAENYLSVQKQGAGELTPTTREQIKNNMQLISETLKKNREQIGKLEAQLKNNNIQSAALRKTIDRLTSELDQKTSLVITLQEDLAKKNVHIEELDQQVASLKEDVEGLALTTSTQAQVLKAQEKALNTAYYCFGTSKELKDQKILTGGGLFAKSKVLQDDFNREYFISIDIREVTEISLFATKANLKSNHPEGSYQFIKDEDKNLIFKITDTNVFWSLGKYLVIEVG